MNYQDRISREMVQAIAEHGADIIEDLGRVDAGEVHHNAYNMDYFIIGNGDAKEWLGEYAFDAIGICQEYEQDNFGEVYTDYSSPEKVVNMLAYVIGEELLGECETLQNNWGEDLDGKQCLQIAKELRGVAGLED